jgi:negative regulator of sigma E activity
MNEALKMQISAFVDGELPENEAELLLRRLNQDVVMRQQVAVYLAIGRHIRRDPEVPGMDALRSRIAQDLGEDSPVAAGAATVVRPRFLKPALGFAVAASVAVLAVVGLRQSILPDVGDSGRAATIAETSPATPITQAPAESAVDSVVSEELREMYRRHNASSADFGANGMITRLVTLELQGGELVEIDPGSRSASPEPASHPDEPPDGESADGEAQQAD